MQSHKKTRYFFKYFITHIFYKVIRICITNKRNLHDNFTRQTTVQHKKATESKKSSTEFQKQKKTVHRSFRNPMYGINYIARKKNSLFNQHFSILHFTRIFQFKQIKSMWNIIEYNLTIRRSQTPYTNSANIVNTYIHIKLFIINNNN